MLGRKNTVTVLGILVFGLLMTAGCSGHSVRYGANSEGDGDSLAQGESGGTGNGASAMGYGADGRGGYSGGAVNGNTPFAYGSASGPGVVNGALSEGMSAEGGSGTHNSSGADYGHNYSGIPGSGPTRGGVDGFSQGSASGINPDPEAWSNAYLRGGESSQDFYGDPSGMGGATGERAVNPHTWGDTYARENGGPSPEYVDPEMQIAQVKNGQGTGLIREMATQDGSTGMRRSDGQLQDIYFAFDSWAITPQGAQDLERGAQWLQSNPGEILTIEGHCDQRGTQDYNLVLGKRRAEAAREYLQSLGIDSHRIKVVSYGKERPFCQKDNEDCFQANRRSHMVIHQN